MCRIQYEQEKENCVMLPSNQRSFPFYELLERIQFTNMCTLRGELMNKRSHMDHGFQEGK